jgi:hypothetical protein
MLGALLHVAAQLRQRVGVVSQFARPRNLLLLPLVDGKVHVLNLLRQLAALGV